MNYLTLDFETYYDKEINLKKMTTQAYVMHPQMEVLMVSAKFNEAPVQIIDGEQIPTFFATVDWSNTAVIAHNAVFDGSILYWRYGVRPAMLIDTMSMAQALGVPTIAGSASLATCIRLLQEAGYAVPPKGTEVLDALGKRRADFTPQQWAAYREYCKNDTDITWFLFKVLRQYLTDEEMRFQDIILRCYTEPRLTVDIPTVEYELNRCRTYKAEQLAEVCKMFGTTQDNLSALLRSNDKFAEVLRSIGGVTEEEAEQGKSGTFIIPTKVSEKTGKTTWAFGKTDVAFKELCEHDDPKIQAVCQARLAAKSSIDETRCLKFLEYGSYGFLPMGYKIGGAHTNRMSGGSAGCFVGETMIVVLPAGAVVGAWTYRMIKDVQPTDLIWDGSDWCAHDGVVCHGVKRVYNWDGLTATKNHECFTNSEREYTKPFKWFMDNRYVLAKAQLPAGGIYESMPESNVCYADGAKAMVYDILNVGDRHCYVANGKLVHNSANMQNLPSGRREGQSDLLRRSIIAQGNSVIVNYDASQIECRVLAYIANQTDVLGVFASGGDVYSFAASKIHGIPYQEIVDGRKSSDPETAHKYSMMRQYGKTATLALGYGQGAQGFQKYALVNTGINMTMDESANTVRAWRDANSFITGFWRMCDQALATMVAGGQMYFGGADGKMFFADGNRYIFGRKVAGIRMPNGLWLNYPNLSADFTNPRRPQYFYDKCGYNGKPLKTKVYSGLVAENCIAEDTEVLTDSGWKKIQDVTLADKVHDGVEFVNHRGLLFKSIQECVSIDGVYMTPDHEVLTDDDKWTKAEVFLSDGGTSQLKRLDRTTLRHINCNGAQPHRWQALVVDVPMRLWKYLRKGCGRTTQVSNKGAYSIMRMPDARSEEQGAAITWYGYTPCVCNMAQYESPMPQSTTQGIPQLRWEGHNCMRGVAAFVRGVLGRYARNLPVGAGFRPYRQQWSVLQRELPVDNAESERQQQAQFHSYRNPSWSDELAGVCKSLWSRAFNGMLSGKARNNHARTGVTTKRKMKVYDIMNCGPRHRFVVRGNEGAFIVHNCTQALAFAVMKTQAVWIAQYYPIVMNTHDEWCIVVPREQAEVAAEYMHRCMCTAPDYIQGIPLASEGGWAQSYGAVDDDWSKRPNNPDRKHIFNPQTGEIL